ncbi:nuclear transport factor 2 family protein [Streptomyces sp. NPDC048002]|uniref:nuclear transport factor 2 family protein n=1 Tax=Streptomyces sp. NPDC048002 TaxID=3154344 RepID=UPI0033D4A4D3
MPAASTSLPTAPAVIGHRFLAVLDTLRVELHFEAADRLTFTVTDGGGIGETGRTETVDTHMVQIRPGLFLNSWRETSGAVINHVEDFTSGALHSNIALPDGTLIRLSGTLTSLGELPLPLPGTPEANKQTVLTAMHELFEQGDLTALDRYWAEPYVQHNPNLPNGLDALRTTVPTLKNFSWTPHRIVATDDLVIAHSRVLGWDSEPVIIADIFRLDGGRIVEHWDVIQPETPAGQSVNGNPMV